MIAVDLDMTVLVPRDIGVRISQDELYWGVSPFQLFQIKRVDRIWPD